jgi:TolB-like protein/Flp pilus assembly protein TadD
MTEEMITQLGRLRPEQLGVIARTSAMRFKKSEKSIDQIGHALGVDYVLEGSVRRAGDRVRITAGLIHVSDETTRWAHEYDDRSVADLFDVQADVAKRIASALAIELLPNVLTRLDSPRPVDPEAYEAYVKGRYYWNKRTEESLNKGLEYFRQAIDLDPTYGMAYVGLAETYVLLPEYGSLLPERAFPLARAAAERALALNEELGAAHAVLASVKYDYEWKREEAEREYQRAISLDPGHATAHHWYAIFLGDCGRLDEALEEIERAQELDPLSPIITSVSGWIYYCRREYERAIEQYQRAIGQDPDFDPAYGALALAYIQQRDIEKALSAAQTAARLSSGHPSDLAVLGMAYAHAGQHADARETLGRLNELPDNRPGRSVALALVHLALGEHEEALNWLSVACDRRDLYVLELKVNPICDPLRDDPRFDDLLRRIGLKP